MAATYRTGEVIEILIGQRATAASRACLRMLDYWHRSGAITPSVVDAYGSGSGSRNVWSKWDLDRLLMIWALREKVGRMRTEIVRTIWQEAVNWRGAKVIAFNGDSFTAYEFYDDASVAAS